MAKGFKNRLIEIEFLLEKGQASHELVHELTDLYTQAAIHYDAKGEKTSADIYRSKI